MSTGRLGAGDTAIQPTIFDAKGDLLTATAGDTPARIAVGNSGETLVADSSATTGLRWQGDYAAGKNKIINGDFRINQRAFTSNTTTNTFGFDRFKQFNSGGTFTTSPQTFTVGAAPVAGYEAINFLRGITASQSAAGDYAVFSQPIEDVRTFAGQTITISFWAKAGSGTPSIGVEAYQQFASGGSTPVSIPAGAVTISTSWARYSVTVAIPSISGKTIAANNSLEIFLWVSSGATLASRASSIGIQNNTFDIWGVQVEAGSVATAFQTATGTLAGELAACQRYYYRQGGNAVYESMAIGNAADTLNVFSPHFLPVQMRVAPTSVDYSTLGISDLATGVNSVTAVIIDSNSKQIVRTKCTTASTLTQYRAYHIVANNSTSGFIAFNAEL